MNNLIFIALFTLLSSSYGFSQISYNWGNENSKSTRSIDLYLVAFRTNRVEGGGGDYWDGLTLSYDHKNDRFSALYSIGLFSLAQYLAAIGPELDFRDTKKLGLKTKIAVSGFIFPLQFDFIPRYNFTTHKFSFAVQTEWGLGLIIPLFNNPDL